MDMEKRKNEDYMRENFPDLKKMIDKKIDFYKCLKRSFSLDVQNRIAQYILGKNENIYINNELLNLFQIPKDYKDKVNIDSHILQSHLDMLNNEKSLYKQKNLKKIESEKMICRRLVQQNYKYNNRKDKPNYAIDIIDFEVPVIYSNISLKNKKKTTNRCSENGAVDIVAKKGNELFLIEAKDFKSPESLLRCITEIKTYYEKIMNHSAEEQGFISAKEMFEYSYGVSKITPAIMIFEGTKPFEDLESLSKNKNLEKIADGIKFFIIKPKNNNEYFKKFKEKFKEIKRENIIVKREEKKIKENKNLIKKLKETNFEFKLY